MSRSVKYNALLGKKVPEDYRRNGNHRRYYAWVVLTKKRKQMEKDLKTLHPIELYQTPKDIYISLMERLSRAYN